MDHILMPLIYAYRLILGNRKNSLKIDIVYSLQFSLIHEDIQ